jgi:hypothetical protein
LDLYKLEVAFEEFLEMMGTSIVIYVSILLRQVNALLLTEPLIVDDSALQQLLGVITKMPYSEGVRQSLAAGILP